LKIEKKRRQALFQGESVQQKRAKSTKKKEGGRERETVEFTGGHSKLIKRYGKTKPGGENVKKMLLAEKEGIYGEAEMGVSQLEQSRERTKEVLLRRQSEDRKRDRFTTRGRYSP